MGLKPVLGRLLNAARRWAECGRRDGADVSLLEDVAALRPERDWQDGAAGELLRRAQRDVVGVLEPSVPYPVATEIIANVVTSPHHLSATMVTGREHRMTEVFARLAPGATVEAARAELSTAYAAMVAAHPEVYKPGDHYQIEVTRMHDQINARANTILWVLFAASGLLFVIACSNVANLVLARTVRREPELAVRSALGASTAVLRRSLLAESLVLCGSGAVAASAAGGPDGGGAGAVCGALLGAGQ
jgi:putative ABC transport system permease protein